MYLSAPEKGKHTYIVEGYLGGKFTNYQDAVKCAKEASKYEEYDYECVIYVAESYVWYDKFAHGKLVVKG